MITTVDEASLYIIYMLAKLMRMVVQLIIIMITYGRDHNEVIKKSKGYKWHGIHEENCKDLN